MRRNNRHARPHTKLKSIGGELRNIWRVAKNCENCKYVKYVERICCNKNYAQYICGPMAMKMAHEIPAMPIPHLDFHLTHPRPAESLKSWRHR